MDNLTQSFFNGTPSTMTTEVVDTSLEKLQLQLSPVANTTTPTTIAHQRRARELHSLAVEQTGDLFQTLKCIRDEKAYLSLGHTSFNDYVKALKREAEYLSIDVTTFYRKIDHQEVKKTLSAAGVDTRNLTQQQSALLKKVADPEKQVEAYKLAQEKSDAEPPSGPGAKYHHPNKVYLEKLEEAIAEVKDPFEGDREEQQTPEPERPDFFSEENKQRVSAKPLPPPMPTETPVSAEEDEDGEMLALLKITPIETAEGSFIFFSGVDDGGDIYTIPVRLDTVRELIGK